MGFRLRFSLKPIQWFTSLPIFTGRSSAQIHQIFPSQKAGWRPLRSTAPGGPWAPNVSPVPHSGPPTARRSCCGWTLLGSSQNRTQALLEIISHQTWHINQKKWLKPSSWYVLSSTQVLLGETKLHVFIWCEPRIQKKPLPVSSWIFMVCQTRQGTRPSWRWSSSGGRWTRWSRPAQGSHPGNLKWPGIAGGKFDSGWLVGGWPTALKNDGVLVSWDDDIRSKPPIRWCYQQTFRVGVAKNGCQKQETIGNM